MAPEDSTPRDRTPEARERAELEKLELEIRHLKQPWYKRPITYVNGALAFSAVVGVAGQSLLSNIRAERTLLDAERAQEAARQASVDREQAVAEAARAEEDRRRAQEDAAAAVRLRDDARKQMRSLQSQIAGLEKDLEAGSETGRRLTEIGQNLVRARVANLIADQLGLTPEEVQPSASLIDDLGADSLDVVELVMALEEEFDLEIPDEDAQTLQTVGNVFEYLERRKAP